MIDFKNGAFVKLKQTDVVPGAIHELLIEGETVVGVYKAVRDYVAFTDKRIIACNVQGVTGKKQDFTSLPYSKFSAFSVETAGALDMDCELDIYVPGVLGRVRFEFSGSTNIKAIGQAIASRAL